MENNELDIMGLDEMEIENTSIDEIDNESVNLIGVFIDRSGSMGGYVGDMIQCQKDFKDALSNSKEVDEILVAKGEFNDRITIGGYKKITDFDTKYVAGGSTALYDVIKDGSEKLTDYMTFLKNQGMRVKAVFAVFSDGEDTCSRVNVTEARKCVEAMNNAEITTAFISFGYGADTEAKSLGFKNILSVGSSTSDLRKAFDCLSKSVIESSKNVLTPDNDNFFI